MEQQLVALAKRLRQERIPTTMVFARPPAAFPGDALREAGVRLRHLDFARPPCRLARELWSWMRVERPRIAHFHFIDPYSPLVVAAGLAGARVLIHDHLALSRGDPLRAAWKGLRSLLLNGLFDERVAVSSFVARTIREVHRVPAARLSVVDNAVDIARFESADGRGVREELRLGDSPLIVSVARLDDEKGGEWLLRALPQVGRGAHLAMVGEGRRPAGGGDRFRADAGDRGRGRAGGPQAGCPGAGGRHRWPAAQRRARAQARRSWTPARAHRVLHGPLPRAAHVGLPAPSASERRRPARGLSRRRGFRQPARWAPGPPGACGESTRAPAAARPSRAARPGRRAPSRRRRGPGAGGPDLAPGGAPPRRRAPPPPPPAPASRACARATGSASRRGGGRRAAAGSRAWPLRRPPSRPSRRVARRGGTRPPPSAPSRQASPPRPPARSGSAPARA